MTIKIVDPDDLNQNTEIYINASASGTIQLVIAGNLGHEGVTLQCVYSFLKEEWRTDTNLIKYPFPMIAITEESMELVNSWNWHDQTTRELIRDGGWALKDNGSSYEEYMNITTLGSFEDSTDQAYYIQTASGIPNDFVYDDAVNEAVKIYGDVDHGDFDYRSFFNPFLREYQKTYDTYDLTEEQDLSVLTYKKYALPLSNSSDSLKVTHDDTTVSGTAPYNEITVKYYDTPQGKDVDGAETRYFDVIIDAGSGKNNTLEQIYERIQYLLRQSYNINDHTTDEVRGDTAGELLEFVGDTLKTKTASWVWIGDKETGGVFIENVKDADVNRVEFMDNTGTLRTYPYTAAGSLLFNPNLVSDADGHYWMYFTATPSGNYGTDDAILVEDNAGYAISGTIGGQSDISFTFDYDGNEQGGRTKSTNANVTIVAIGLETAQFVSTANIIKSTKTNNFSIVSALERNYSNE
jgi:hypothetical protein